MLVSAVSLWEIVVKVRVGKLEADIGEILAAIEREGFALLGISPAHLMTLSGLPLHSDHRAPFDHLLIAQAITMDAAFVSEDRNAPLPRANCQLLRCIEGLFQTGLESLGESSNTTQSGHSCCETWNGRSGAGDSGDRTLTMR